MMQLQPAIEEKGATYSKRYLKQDAITRTTRCWRKIEMDISRQVNMFDELAKNFSDMSTKPNYRALLFETEGALDEDVLRQFEKEVKDWVKCARLIIAAQG